MGIFNKKASKNIVRSALWDGTALHALSREGYLDALVRTDGDRPRLEDKRERGGKATIVAVSPALKWAMIETPEHQTAAGREEEAYWSLLSGREDPRFTPDGTACGYLTAPGIAGKTPTIAYAMPKNSLELLDAAVAEADWTVTRVVPFPDALRAGCQELAPAAQGERKAWLALGDSKSFLIVGDGSGTAYLSQFGWGASEVLTDNGIDKITIDLEANHTELIQRISADTPVSGITIICPSDNILPGKWRGVAVGLEDSMKINVLPFDSPQLEALQRIALIGASRAPSDPETFDFWKLKPANERRLSRMLLIGLVGSVLVLSGAFGFSVAQKQRLAAALDMEKKAEAEAKALPDPAIERKKFESEAASLAERISKANQRKETADASRPKQETSPVAAGDAMTAFAGFSAKDAGLDGFSVRWSSESEQPALSAVGTAKSRDGAVAAALSLSRIGYGKWGSSQVGWTGKSWTFRMEEPKSVSSSPSSATASIRSGSPTFGSPGEKAGNMASAGPDEAAHGERLPRIRPGSAALPPQTAPVKKQ